MRKKQRPTLEDLIFVLEAGSLISLMLLILLQLTEGPVTMAEYMRVIGISCTVLAWFLKNWFDNC